MHPAHNPTKPYPTTQVVHDSNQVKSPGELVVGGHYIRRWDMEGVQGEGDSLLKIIEVIEQPGQHLFKAHVTSRTTSPKPRFTPYETTLLFADFGITPFHGGVWEPFNYLVRAQTAQ